MDKKVRFAIWGLFISLLSAAVFAACDKDTKCYLDVNVYNGNSSSPIPGAKVQIYQMACDTSDYNYVEGKTDGAGLFSTEYSAPGIFRVRATLLLDTVNSDSTLRGQRQGNATVRLAEGETSTCNVRMSMDTTWISIN